MNQFEQAIARIDQANAQDPRGEELLYAQRMTRWLEDLDPGASEALKLAVRAQHLERWRIPRSSYPLDRRGYHQWRTKLAEFHAQRAGEILSEVGYQDAMIERVAMLIQKQAIKSDPEAQTLEDVACLVFLEHELVEFAAKHSREKIINILRRAWSKMSAQGHAAALRLNDRLPLPAQLLLSDALNS